MPSRNMRTIEQSSDSPVRSMSVIVAGSAINATCLGKTRTTHSMARGFNEFKG
jgi:hypothetical protein